MRTLLSAVCFSLLSGIVSAAPPAAEPKPDVRITVKAVTAGTDRNGKSAVASRRLEIRLENREHRKLSGLQVDWKIFGEDIRSDKKSVDAKGVKTVSIDADGVLEVESDVAKFTETEGGVKTTGKGKNKRRIPQPDTGKRYAGYVVEIKQGGQVIAEASTNSLGKPNK